jgi:hypothetical protein
MLAQLQRKVYPSVPLQTTEQFGVAVILQARSQFED